MKKSSGSAKMTPSPSQPQKTLLHFFQNKSTSTTPISKIPCPGCNLQIPTNRINSHLDFDCKSKNAKSCNIRKRKSLKGKVEAKIKLKRAMLSDSEEDSDIDILEKVKNEVADMMAKNSDFDNKAVNPSTSTSKNLLSDWTSPHTTPVKTSSCTTYINRENKELKASGLDTKTVDAITSTSKDFVSHWTSPPTTPIKIISVSTSVNIVNKELEINDPETSGQNGNNSEDDFESSTPVFRKAKPTPKKYGSTKKEVTPFKSTKKQSKSNNSTPMKKNSRVEHTLSSDSSRDSSPDSAKGSIRLFSPTPSPSIVSPERSRSPSPENLRENQKNTSRKLFTITTTPSKESQIKIASFAGIEHFSNSLQGNDAEDFEEQKKSWEKLMTSSKSESLERNPNGSRNRSRSRSRSKSRSRSSSNKRSPTISPNKNSRSLRQTIKKTGLFGNSSQVVSMVSPKKRSSLIKNSPQKSTNSTFFPQSPSKDGMQLSQSNKTDDKPDPSFYRNKMSYYLENFMRILDTVMSNPQDITLFNDKDLSSIQTFHGFSLQAKKLYVRLFQRKIKWNRVQKIIYPEIADNEDIEMYINELTYAEFLLNESEMNGLEEVLPLLTNEEIHSLCKEMKISTVGKKEVLVASLIQSSKKQPSIMAAFSKSQQARGNSIVLKKGRAIAGRCCMINKEIRRLFMRVLCLYSLPCYDDDEEGGAQSQLTTLLMVNMGKMIFPDYEILRKLAIFRSRNDLIKFEECSQLENDVRECMEAHKWQEAIELILSAKTLYEELNRDVKLMAHDATLPTFLRRFTSVSILLYILTCGVEAYQRLKDYKSAVDLLQELLNQKTHLQDYRGRWFMRMALNLEQHLKQPSEAIRIIGMALNDKEVQFGHRLSLSMRAQRMRCAPRYKAHFPAIDRLFLMNPIEAPKVIIEGRSLPGDIPGQKRQFIRQDSDRHSGDGTVMVCSVEELVIGYYNSIGYSEGLHREGSTFRSLFGIYFWDVFYAPVLDVFRSPYQGTPLDLDSPHFYQSRKDIIDSRLSEMRQWSEDDAFKVLENVWSQHHDKCSIVNWDLFRNLDHAKGLVTCIGMKVLSAICERLAQFHRFTRSGFPDLVVWEPKNKICRIVEVKGPNDHLSTKQILWLDFLIANGANAEVCHVEAIGAKKMVMKSPKKISPKKLSPKKDLLKKSPVDKELANKKKKGRKRKVNEEEDKAEEKEVLKDNSQRLKGEWSACDVEDFVDMASPVKKRKVVKKLNQKKEEDDTVKKRRGRPPKKEKENVKENETL